MGNSFHHDRITVSDLDNKCMHNIRATFRFRSPIDALVARGRNRTGGRSLDDRPPCLVLAHAPARSASGLRLVLGILCRAGARSALAAAALAHELVEFCPVL